jgi:hypothetical protein
MERVPYLPGCYRNPRTLFERRDRLATCLPLPGYQPPAFCATAGALRQCGRFLDLYQDVPVRILPLMHLMQRDPPEPTELMRMWLFTVQFRRQREIHFF